jgi:hypothetical protein
VARRKDHFFFGYSFLVIRRRFSYRDDRDDSPIARTRVLAALVCFLSFSRARAKRAAPGYKSEDPLQSAVVAGFASSHCATAARWPSWLVNPMH